MERRKVCICFLFDWGGGVRTDGHGSYSEHSVISPQQYLQYVPEELHPTLSRSIAEIFSIKRIFTNFTTTTLAAVILNYMGREKVKKDPLVPGWCVLFVYRCIISRQSNIYKVHNIIIYFICMSALGVENWKVNCISSIFSAIVQNA